MSTQSTIRSVGSTVKIRNGEVIFGERFRPGVDGVEPSTIIGDGKTKAKITAVSPRTSMGPDADNAISYRLSMNHPTDTYAVEELDTDPRPTKASQEKLSGSVGGQPDLTRLLSSGKICYLLVPLSYKHQGSTITIPKGIKVAIVGRAQTSSGGKPETISPQKAYYAFKVYNSNKYPYRWKSGYINEAKLDFSV